MCSLPLIAYNRLCFEQFGYNVPLCNVLFVSCTWSLLSLLGLWTYSFHNFSLNWLLFLWGFVCFLSPHFSFSPSATPITASGHIISLAFNDALCTFYICFSMHFALNCHYCFEFKFTSHFSLISNSNSEYFLILHVTVLTSTNFNQIFS